jgi:hypothetical protein
VRLPEIRQNYAPEITSDNSPYRKLPPPSRSVSRDLLEADFCRLLQSGDFTQNPVRVRSMSEIEIYRQLDIVGLGQFSELFGMLRYKGEQQICQIVGIREKLAVQSLQLLLNLVREVTYRRGNSVGSRR